MRQIKFKLLGNEYTVAAGLGELGGAAVKITPSGTVCDFDLEIAPTISKSCALSLAEAYLSTVLNYPHCAVEVMLCGKKYYIEPQGKNAGTVAYKMEKCKDLFTKTIDLADLCTLEVSNLTYSFGTVCLYKCDDVDCVDRALLRRLLTIDGVSNIVSTCIFANKGKAVYLLTEAPLVYATAAVIDVMRPLCNSAFRIYCDGAFIADNSGRAAVELLECKTF